MNQARKMWIAFDRRGKIIGVWWRGCKQPKERWEKACMFIHKGTVYFNCYNVIMQDEWKPTNDH